MLDARDLKPQKGRPTEPFIAAILGISAGNLHNWRHGKSLGPKVLATMAGAFHRHWRIGEDGLHAFFDEQGERRVIDQLFAWLVKDEISVRKYGELLGYRPNQKSKVLDLAFFNDAPLLMSMYYDHEGGANEPEVGLDFRQLAGIYQVDIERDLPDGRSVSIRGRLDVRYRLQVTPYKWLIRTKLLVQYYNEDRDECGGIAVCDGWVRMLRGNAFNPHVVWLFQKRYDPTRDFTFFITSLPENRVMTGQYLTMDQHGRPTAGPVKLQRRADLGSDGSVPDLPQSTLIDAPSRQAG